MMRMTMQKWTSEENERKGLKDQQKPIEYLYFKFTHAFPHAHEI